MTTGGTLRWLIALPILVAGWAAAGEAVKPPPGVSDYVHLHVTRNEGALLSCPVVLAPDALLKEVTQEVVAIIGQDAGMQEGNAARVADLVETKILPHFDFDRMTRIAVARGWRVATPEQQAVLTHEFKTLLIRTYSTALSGYRNQTIEFRPLRAAAGDTEVTVRSVIRQPGVAPLALDYDMEKLDSGWKVFDIKIEGVSLVSNYRETFATRIREGGVAGLLRSLAEKNRQGDARFRSHKTGDFTIPAALVHAFATRLLYISHSR